jgi:DNA-binding NtrC family response regulator
MKEEMMIGTMERTGDQYLPAVSSQSAREPGNGNGSHSSQRQEREAISALAFSLDNLYGCIEQINEGKPAPLKRIMRELERDIISQAMTQARANIRKAAVLLGVKHTTLYAKINSKAIRFNTDRSGLNI